MRDFHLTGILQTYETVQEERLVATKHDDDLFFQAEYERAMHLLRGAANSSGGSPSYLASEEHAVPTFSRSSSDSQPLAVLSRYLRGTLRPPF